jgi:hypothetical protein
MEYSVTGKIIIYVDNIYEANSEEEAKAMAKEDWANDYNLDVYGYSHIPDEVQYELFADEIEDED